jgi:hypothetical protein
MRTKIKISYKHSGDAKLSLLTLRIMESLKDNPYFPNPTPALATLESAHQEFAQALKVSGRYDRTRVSAKNDKKAALIDVLSQLAGYIEATSEGDKTKLLSSGFEIVGEKTNTGVLPPITQFEVEIGTPGQAITRVNKVPGARSYIHQYTPDPITSDSVWVSETITDRQHTFNNLPSIAKVWFRVIAIGHGRQSVYSAVISRVIQ